VKHNKSCSEKFTRHPPPPPPQPQQRSGRSLESKVSIVVSGSSIEAILTVKITLALLGDAAATLVVIDLEDLDLLEGLHDLAVNAARGGDVVRGTAAAVLGAAVDLAETANTDGLPEVDVAGNGSGADVEPVDVLGGHLLGGAGLDGVNPTYTQVKSANLFCHHEGCSQARKGN